jgi:hypothetical protein
VRDEKMMSQIWTYIENNPLQWAMDRENPERHGVNKFESWLYAESIATNPGP